MQTFTLKYAFASIRKNVFLSVFSTIALSVSIVLLTIALGIPRLVDDVFKAYAVQFSGTADIVVTLNPDSDSRFFSLAELNTSEYLSQDIKENHGIFRTFVALQAANAQQQQRQEQSQSQNTTGDFIQLIAADFLAQQSSNPIVGNYLPTALTNNHIIISQSIATRHNINHFDTIYILQNERAVPFYIIAKAAPQGIFMGAETAFISSAALSRIIPMFPTGIINNAFITAQSAAAADRIVSTINQNALYSHLQAHILQEVFNNSVAATSTRIQTVLLSFIGALTAVAALFVLLRLKNEKARKDFEFLKSVGLSNKQMLSVALLCGAMLASVAVAIAVGVIFAIMAFLHSAHFLASGLSIAGFVWAISLAGGFLLGVVASIIGIKNASSKKTSRKNNISKYVYIAIFAISLALTIIFISVSNSINSMALVVLFVAVVAIIISAPKIIEYLCTSISKLKQNIYSLRLRETVATNGYTKLLSFAMCAMLVVLISTAQIITTNAGAAADIYPFDVAVIEVANIESDVLEQLESSENIEKLARAKMLLGASVTIDNAEQTANIIALDYTGLLAMGITSSQIQQMGNSGAIVGSRLKQDRFVNIGDTISFSYRNTTESVAIAGVINTDYFGGNVAFIRLEKLATENRAFNELLIWGSGNVSAAALAQSVGSAIELGGIAVTANNLSAIRGATLGDTATILNTICIIMIILVAAVVALLITLQAKAANKKAQKLRLLGLKKSNDVAQILLAVSLTMLLSAAFMPLIMLAFSTASRAIFIANGIRSALRFYTTNAIITSLLSAVFAIAVFVAGYAVQKNLQKN